MQKGGIAIDTQVSYTKDSRFPNNRERKMKDGMRTILRCTCLALMVMAALAIIPAAMEAQTHLMTIGKSCVSPKNRCTTDADCADANLCDGAEQCATLRG